MTYQQHVYCLTKLGCFACPRELILSNLVKEIQQWQEDGDQVVVLTDCNGNVSLASIRQWAGQLGLVEAITWLHLEDAPPTFQWGSSPIDSIFMAS